MGQVHHYTVHGLHIGSERPLPELYPGDEDADVSIRWGRVPDTLSGGAVYTGLCYQASTEAFLYDMPQVARYFVQSGSSITVEPYPDADPASVRLVLFGPIMTALGCQLGLIPLVGSSVVHQGKATLFIGPAGSGRTTIVSELSRRGHSVLGDGICMVDASRAKPMLQPAMPRLKLFDDEAYPLDKAHPLPTGAGGHLPLRAQHKKYSVAIPDRFHPAEAPLVRIIDLSVGSARDLELAELDGAKQLGALMEHSLNAHFIRKIYGEATYFRWCVKIVGAVSVLRLGFTHEVHPVHTVVDVLEKKGFDL